MECESTVMYSMGVKFIPLSNGHLTTVDDDDYLFLDHFKWQESKGYVVHAFKGRSRRGVIAMHRMLLLPGPDEQVDHINGDTLDNRRVNLRLCTGSENRRNQKKTRGSSRYKGVCWNKQRSKWQATIKKNQKGQTLGLFDDEVSAALAYDVAALDLFGEFARPNFLQPLTAKVR